MVYRRSFSITTFFRLEPESSIVVEMYNGITPAWQRALTGLCKTRFSENMRIIAQALRGVFDVSIGLPFDW